MGARTLQCAQGQLLRLHWEVPYESIGAGEHLTERSPHYRNGALPAGGPPTHTEASLCLGALYLEAHFQIHTMSF